ncbi:class I SAM-dependent methyltransferase [Ectobacillus antri]|uniref:Class I SAM-dependent methyltransferase n=1 Tax=Ectobacillus antri TaxID=2486280 RepID=A0ABT6H4H5_9BACI|nr:class I SAM-dependent methyltransferase [Ectobacillus antri]MDG4656829.1 class I SAM-dependent methyltransferase [Ectobacillus antri]MDG5754274.1 class I SAM-dependent methyltransferase [Ectobacillus antri]
MHSYIDFLALFGVGSAHPGGFALTKQLLTLLPLNSNTKVLDLGCGTGRTAVYIAKQYGCQVTALDYHPVMIEKAKRRILQENVNIELVHGNAEQLPFADESFDVIITESVIAFTNISRTLSQLYRVLRKRGYVAGTEMTIERPLYAQEYDHIRKLYGAAQYLTEQQWHEHFTKQGFQRVDVIHRDTVATAEYEWTSEWDISANISQSLYEIWEQHEKILALYGHVLGHRVFRCQK